VLSHHVLAVLVSLSFAAGLNVYATVATLGLLDRAGLVELPGALDAVASWWVIGAASLLFAIEFFADKIPYVDLVWNVLHTFVRVPAGAVIAWAATSDLDPRWQLGIALAGGAIALVAHGGKLAVRAAVTASPEPASNIALSLAEDALAIGLTWFATTYPYLAAAGVAVLVVVAFVLIRWIVRAGRALFRSAARS
jgi:Domain of unknown function (DUF4126)